MKKIIKNVVSSLLIVVACGFSFFTGFVTGETKAKNELTANLPTSIDEEKKADSFIINESEMEENGIALTFASVETEDYEVMGISEDVESARTVTATIENEDAGNKNLIWTIEWNGSTATWGGATEKTINDYVTMNVAERVGVTQTATLSCYGAFGTQILVTVMPEENPDLKKTCTLDYAQKITSASLNIGNIEVNLGGDTEIEVELGEEITGDGGVIECDYITNDIYTLEEEFTPTIYFYIYKLGVDFKLNDKTIKIYNMQMGGLNTELYFDYKNTIKDWRYNDGAQEVPFYELSVEAREEMFSVLTQPYFRSVNLTIKGIYGEFYIRSNLKVSGYRNSTPVSAMSLDSMSFVF